MRVVDPARDRTRRIVQSGSVKACSKPWSERDRDEIERFTVVVWRARIQWLPSIAGERANLSYVADEERFPHNGSPTRVSQFDRADVPGYSPLGRLHAIGYTQGLLEAAR